MGQVVAVVAMTLLLAGEARAACPDPSSATELILALNRAENAFSALDLEGFEQARLEVDAVLPCVDAPLSAVDAAQIHRVAAMGAYVGEDQQRAVLYFASAMRIQPHWQLPPALALPGTPLMEVWTEARDMAPPLRPEMTGPRRGSVLVDGERTLLRPEDQPVLMQHIDDDGLIIWTALLMPDEGHPGWAVPLETPLGSLEPVGPSLEELREQRRRRAGWVSAAGASALVAGGLYAGALVSKGQFNDPTLPYPEVEATWARARGLTLGAGAAGAAAVGLSVAAVVRW